MKRHQRGHIEVEYGDPTQEAKLWTGVAICAVGFAVIVFTVGWGAALGIGIAMWGYKLQTDGQDEKRADGVGVLDAAGKPHQPPMSTLSKDER